MTDLRLGVDTSLFEPIPRSLRQENVTKLLETLAEMPRGKTAELSETMMEMLSGKMTEQELRSAIGATSNYSARHPDADIGAKLAAVDWEGDKTLLFVGRIIASKGLQSIIAALPLILDKHPTARLLVVGHGPLREALEALLWALEHGKQSLAERIIEWGSSLEGSTPKPFTAVRCFYDHLREQGELDSYFEKAQQYLRADRIIFTGFLTHRELRRLFPCCDVAIFPSVVAEAGPLVFLEALASGCFPLGTYFAGMAASIDSVATALPAEDAELMKLSANEDYTVGDIAANVSGALLLGDKHKEILRKAAEERYDWTNVARKLASELRSIT
jgi:glycosyltransferase involved in cell wall biosynthesis